MKQCCVVVSITTTKTVKTILAVQYTLFCNQECLQTANATLSV